MRDRKMIEETRLATARFRPDCGVTGVNEKEIMGAGESVPSGSGGGATEGLQMGEAIARCDSDAFRLWTTLTPCTKGDRKGTLFIRTFSGDAAQCREFGENGIKCLRQLRHPCVLQYLESQSLPNELRLLTERVQLLDACIDSLSAIEIRAGLRSILEALHFLHSKANLSHNNVCPASVFVAEDGSWRLGGMEFTRAVNWGVGGVHDKRDDLPLHSEYFKEIKDADFVPPEDRAGVESSQRGCARDVFGLGRLVECTIEYLQEIEGEERVVADFRSAVSAMTSEAAEDRPTLRDCLNMPAFNNPLSDIEDFVRAIQTMGDEEKDEFFASLLPTLRALPPRVVGRRLARSLLSRYVILDRRAHAELLPALLQPECLLPLDSFRSFLLPECTHVLRVRDTAVRLAIMEHFHRFAPFYLEDQLAGPVLREVLIGLEDSDDRIVSSSLVAMAILVPILGADAVLESGGRGRRKIFNDGSPKTTPLVPVGGLSPSCTSSSRAATPSEQEAPSRAPPCAVSPVSPRAKGRAALEELGSLLRVQGRIARPSSPVARILSGSIAEDNRDWDEAEEGGEGEGDSAWNDNWAEEESTDTKDSEEEVAEPPRLVVADELLKKKGSLERSSSGPRTPELSSREREIGSEFSVRATVRTEIDDIFAEMMPSSSSIIDQLEKIAAGTKEKEEKEEKAPSGEKGSGRFNFSLHDDAEDSGWGAEDEAEIE